MVTEKDMVKLMVLNPFGHEATIYPQLIKEQGLYYGCGLGGSRAIAYASSIAAVFVGNYIIPHNKILGYGISAIGVASLIKLVAGHSCYYGRPRRGGRGFRRGFGRGRRGGFRPFARRCPLGYFYSPKLSRCMRRPV